METSPTTVAITAALLAFQKAAPKVHKASINPAFKSKYADISTILDAISGPLNAAGLVVIQFPDGDGLTTRIQHESGEFMQATAKLCAVQQTPQAMGSATTYARRYALCGMLSLVVDDDDGQAATAPAPAVPLAVMLADYPLKTAIRDLLRHESVSMEGMKKTHDELPTMSRARAEKVLAGLKAHIAQYEGIGTPHDAN